MITQVHGSTIQTEHKHPTASDHSQTHPPSAGAKLSLPPCMLSKSLSTLVRPVTCVPCLVLFLGGNKKPGGRASVLCATCKIPVPTGASLKEEAASESYRSSESPAHPFAEAPVKKIPLLHVIPAFLSSMFPQEKEAR